VSAADAAVFAIVIALLALGVFALVMDGRQ
jgi:hypothetical protein